MQPDPSMDELLRRETATSRAAVLQTVRTMKSECRTALRPQVITRSHPWVMTGTAAATGFAVASAVMSRFRKPCANDAGNRHATLAASSGLTAIGIAALSRLLQSPVGASVPSILGTLFNLWQAKQRHATHPATGDNQAR